MWRKNSQLAEIVGIMLGDGCLYLDKKNKYHTTITLHKKELEYAIYVQKLFQGFFEGYSFLIREIATALQVKNVSVRIGSFFVKQGLVAGNKVTNQVAAPMWIFTRNAYVVAFLRGIFDTDGSVYRKYNHYQQVQFKFASKPLIKSVHQSLLQLGFHPTTIQKEVSSGFSSWKIYLSRQKEVLEFFAIIEPKNSKHLLRHNLFKSNTRSLA